MDINSKIYIAGHKGMVGAAITAQLIKLGYTNLVFRSHSELDLTRQSDVENFFARERPEYVFLAAARVGGILANNTYKAEFIYQNIMIAANIVQSSYIYGVKKILNLGSSCIYPKFAPQPMREEHLLSGILEPTNEPYAIAKISAIKLCRYYNEQYKTNFLSVMPTNLYGCHDNYNLETSHVLPSFIRRFHLAKLLRENNIEKIKENMMRYPLGFGWDDQKYLNDTKKIFEILKGIGVTSESVMLWGSGEPYREFLYTDDLADVSIFLMQRYDYKDIGEFVNIGTGKDSKIKDIAELVKDIVGFKGEIIWDKTKPDGTPKKLLDISRVKALGWEPKIDLATGIRMAYEWFGQNKNIF